MLTMVSRQILVLLVGYSARLVPSTISVLLSHRHETASCSNRCLLLHMDISEFSNYISSLFLECFEKLPFFFSLMTVL